MDSYRAQSGRKRTGKARERYEARKRRRAESHVHTGQRASTPTDKRPVRQRRQREGRVRAWSSYLGGIARDMLWRAWHDPTLVWGTAIVVVILFALYFLSFPVTGRVMPNVSAMGIGLGGQGIEAAAEKLTQAWEENVTIELIADREVYETVTPDGLGIQLDAEATARRARGLGLGALPFGGEVTPVVELDFMTAQTYMLDAAEAINERPQNARYAYEDGQVVGVPGVPGRRLDTTSSLSYLEDNTAAIVERGRFELMLTPIEPDVHDPEPYLDNVRQLVAQPLELRGFDPVKNQHFTWPIDASTYTEWLAASQNSLTLREEAFSPYIEMLNSTLNPEGENNRYLSPTETKDKLKEAIAQEQQVVDLRVRYRPRTYEVQAGDTGFAIARKTGIPLFLIRNANSGLELSNLYPGDQLTIPSPDEVMPKEPVPNKRIVVDLESQYLMAFENGQVVFEWPIASGVQNAPTSPGVYQILNHQEVAVGSSSTLCDSAGVVCGQWEMNWFMGIYEVRPGLVNGFHGQVLLPNGNYLGGGAVGRPATFGCVMSPDDQAQQLYEWADVGTTVEVISDEYDPVSDLGELTKNRTNQNL